MLIKIPKEKKPVLHYTAAQEAVVERKLEERLRGQRETPKGRNFLWDTFRFKDENALSLYRNNYDQINWGTR